MAKGVSFVNVMYYGNLGLLIVESDTDSREISVAVNKVIEKKPLTDKETELLQSANMTHLYFNNDSEVQVKKGGLEAVNSYNNAIQNLYEYVYPVGFEMMSYKDNAPTKFNFSFDLTE